MRIETVKDFVETFCPDGSIEYEFGINEVWSYALDSSFLEVYGERKLLSVTPDYSWAFHRRLRFSLTIKEEE